MATKLIALAVIFLVVAGVAVYVYNSGALTQGLSYLKSTVPSGNLVGTSTSSGGGNAGAVSGGSGGGGGGNSGAGSGGGVTIISTPSTPPNPHINASEIPAGFTMSQISPYFHLVRFGGLSSGPQPMLGNTGYGQITLNAYYVNPSSTIDVTGWQIATNRSGEYIPQAVAIYDPLGLNPPSDIILKNGDTLNIYSTSAPVNLRLNECIGYLPNRTQFNPQLPQICPYISTQGLADFSGACQNYILSLNGCREPDLGSPQIPGYDYACKQYLTGRYNYHWCFDTYFSDPQFLGNQVDVWTGSSPLDPSHDEVELLDKNDLLVDFSSY